MRRGKHMAAKTKPDPRAETVRKIRTTRDLEERIKLQKVLDDGRSPLLNSLQGMEEIHGRKEVDRAIEQWHKHEKDGPLGPGGVEPGEERLSAKERALAPPNIPVGSGPWLAWVIEHPDAEASKAWQDEHPGDPTTQAAKERRAALAAAQKAAK
jgi:hypothetical protein